MDPEHPRGIEHSPRPRGASNRQPASLAALLEALLEATGMDRAFVASCATRPPSAAPEVRVARFRDPAGPARPSRGALRRLLEGPGPSLLSDLGATPELRERRSVRSLCLRSLCGAVIPARCPEGSRLVLVADSRRPLDPGRQGLVAALVPGFARVAGLILSAGSGSPGFAAGAPGPELVGCSRGFRRTLDWARRVAPFDLPVLITGESGTGKEGVARAIHRHSHRAGGPFVALNCAAVPETLLESELFGAVRGAYTGSERDREGLMRRAAGGTLLLDEIGDMPAAMQAKLLRVLQTRRLRPVGGDREILTDARVLAATHHDLRRRTDGGSFRIDLYHRIAVVGVHVPALRERIEDLEVLTPHLIDRICEETSLPPATVDPAAMQRLAAHDWPGNVRELRGLLTRALLRAQGGTVRVGDLDLPGRGSGSASCAEYPLERTMIEAALQAAGGNLADAAARIGWSRQKLYRRIEALGVSRESSGGTTSSDSSTFQ